MRTIKPTAAQKIFGKDFGNREILNERPANMRSTDPTIDKILFYNYKAARRDQNKILKKVLHYDTDRWPQRSAHRGER